MATLYITQQGATLRKEQNRFVVEHEDRILDVMEEFRPPVVDRLVLSLINREVFKAGDFQKIDDGGFNLNEAGHIQKEDFKMTKEGFVKRLVGALGMIVGVVLLVSLMRLGLAVYLYAAIARWATSQLGLDYYPAELMGVAFSALIMFFVPGLGSFFFSRKRRMASAALVVGGYLMVCLLVYSIGRDTYFNQSTGEPLRYYAETPDGIVFSFLPGYDPKWGIERKPYTREAAQESLRRRLSAEEQRRKTELELQKRQEEERRRQESLLLKEREAERRRAEAESKRQFELEQRRLQAEAEERKREEERQQSEAQRRHELEQMKIDNERILEEQRVAAELEKERRAEQQQQQTEERERQNQIARDQQEKREQEDRRKEQAEREKREKIYRLIDLGKREAERRTGKRIPWPLRDR